MAIRTKRGWNRLPRETVDSSINPLSRSCPATVGCTNKVSSSSINEKRDSMRRYQDIVLLGTRIALFVFQERRQYAVTRSSGFMDVSDHSIMEKQ